MNPSLPIMFSPILSDDDVTEALKAVPRLLTPLLKDVYDEHEYYCSAKDVMSCVATALYERTCLRTLNAFEHLGAVI